MIQKGSKGFIPPHGGYKELLSYRKAEIVYDLTFRFCQRFLKPQIFTYYTDLFRQD